MSTFKNLGWTAVCVSSLLLWGLGCSDDDSTTDSTAADAGNNTRPNDTGGSGTSNASTSSGSDSGGGGTTGGGMRVECDFEAIDGRVVMEAESLPISEDWVVASDRGGFYGEGFIEWTGPSRNNDPTHGVMRVQVYITEAGQYRLQWRNRIGMGDNPTEHNDTWVQFPDAADYYGYRVDGDTETRRYPQPICEDDARMDELEARDDIREATCPDGSTRDGWLKVYSTNATDWRWSTRTSDNDAHEIGVEFDEPGVYTLMMAARGDHHLIDRLVIHQRSIDDDTVHAENLAETRCP
ncbi:MAG: hypothetical protein AAFX99_04240 [Myxococcota bacterium]